ncbi:MAG: hypothetical protein OHK0017_12660 [Patescibacteria group bacterium]
MTENQDLFDLDNEGTQLLSLEKIISTYLEQSIINNALIDKCKSVLAKKADNKTLTSKQSNMLIDIRDRLVLSKHQINMNINNLRSVSTAQGVNFLEQQNILLNTYIIGLHSDSIRIREIENS